jgi:chemotaxis protein CheC
MSEQIVFWNNVISGSESQSLLRAAMNHAAAGLSGMVGHPISIDVRGVATVPINEVATYAGGPEKEMVGVYLLIDGHAEGQAILILSLTDALYLVDMLMGMPPGTTTALDDLGRSALAEVGNLTLAAFLNTVGTLTGKPLKPSPPAVVVDMLGAFLSVIAAPVAAHSDELVFAEAVFEDSGRTIQARFWILPHPATPMYGGGALN